MAPNSSASMMPSPMPPARILTTNDKVAPATNSNRLIAVCGPWRVTTEIGRCSMPPGSVTGAPPAS